MPGSPTFCEIFRHRRELEGEASDKNESLSLVVVTPSEIEHQLEYYNQHVPPELRNSPTGLEQFIAQNPECRIGLVLIFLWVTLLAKSIWREDEKISRRDIETARIFGNTRTSYGHMRVSWVSLKSKQKMLVFIMGGWYGVFDGATGLAPLTTTKETGGRIAARTAAEVVKNTSGRCSYCFGGSEYCHNTRNG